MIKLLILIIITFAISNPASAYLGPGMGGGVIAATLGIVVAIFAALFGLIWFPVSYLKPTQSRVFISLTIQDSKRFLLPAHASNMES